MSHALVFIADGFEEIEALTSVDLLRRGGVDVKTVSVGGGNLRKGAHGVQILCDTLLSSADWDQADMLVLPGGWPGAENLGQDTVLTGKLKEFAADPKKWVAAICAAPYVLGGLGLLRGKRATCYPGFEKYLEGADVTGAASSVTDISSRAAVQERLLISRLSSLRFLKGRKRRKTSATVSPADLNIEEKSPRKFRFFRFEFRIRVYATQVSTHDSFLFFSQTEKGPAARCCFRSFSCLPCGSWGIGLCRSCRDRCCKAAGECPLCLPAIV